MSEWKECKLFEIMELIGGGTPKTTVPEYWDGNIPWLSVTDFNTGNKYCFDAEKKITEKGLSESSTKILKKGQIIISARGTVGVLSVLGRDMAFNQSCYGIDAKIKLTNNDFLYYLLKDNIASFHSASYGAVFDTITKETFSQIAVSIPPLPEQRAIASVLSSLDDKIDLLHRQNKTLEAMAETLFRQWFVEEAEEGWGEGTLGDVASFHNGKKRPDNIIEGNIPIYGGNGILGYANKSNYEGVTVIIGRVGAYCGSLYIERNPVWISDNALVAKPINKGHPSFLLFLLKSLQLNEMAEGSSHPLLTQTLLKSIQIFLPLEHLIESFVYQADTWLNKIDNNNNQIHTIEKLRDTLLPKLMSGEVRVEYENN